MNELRLDSRSDLCRAAYAYFDLTRCVAADLRRQFNLLTALRTCVPITTHARQSQPFRRSRPQAMETHRLSAMPRLRVAKAGPVRGAKYTRKDAHQRAMRVGPQQDSRARSIRSRSKGRS